MEAFYKTKDGPEDHCLCNPGHNPLNQGKPSRFPTKFGVSVHKAGEMGWEGRWPRWPHGQCWPPQGSRGPGVQPCCSRCSWVVSAVPCPLACLWWCWAFGKLASATEPWGFQLYQGKDRRSEILLILMQRVSLVFPNRIWETPFTGCRTRCLCCASYLCSCTVMF